MLPQALFLEKLVHSWRSELLVTRDGVVSVEVGRLVPSVPRSACDTANQSYDHHVVNFPP